MSLRSRFHYGWVVVAVAAAGMCLIYGIRHTFSVFFPPILEEFGWSRASTAGMYSITILTYGIVALFAGTLGAKYNPKKLMGWGLIFTGGVTAACALSTELWHFYLVYGILVPVGMSFCGWPLLVPAVANWFTKRRGTAIGLAQAGSGFSYTLGLVVEPIIANYGWRWAYVAQAILVVGIILPLYLFFFRYRPNPEDKPKESAAKSNQPQAPEVDWTFSGVMRSKHIWLLFVSFFLFWGFSMYLLLAHQIQFAIDQGFSSMFAASIFALFGFMMVAGMMCSGISDLIGREACAAIACGLGVIGIGALLMVRGTSDPWLMYTYSIGLGLGAGLMTPTVFSGAADIFAGTYYGTATGIILLGLGTGGALGPWLGGLIYDLTGSYRNAFMLALISQAISFIAFYLAAPRRAQDVRARLAQSPAK